MTRVVALLSIGALVTVPLLLLRGPAAVTAAVAAGILCAAGVLGRVPALVTAGVSLTLVQYTLTVMVIGAPSSVPSAIGLGVIMTLALDAFEFHRRFDGATVSMPAWRRQARHWLATVVFGALAASGIASAAELVRIGAPPGLHPILAAAGAVVAVAGTSAAVYRRYRPREPHAHPRG